MNLPPTALRRPPDWSRGGLNGEAGVRNHEARRRRPRRLYGNGTVGHGRQRGFGARGDLRTRLQHEVLARTKDVVEPMERDHLILDRVFERDGGLVACTIARRQPGEGRTQGQRAAVGQRERFEIDVDETIDVADIGVRDGNDAKASRRAGWSEDSPAHGQIFFQMHFDDLVCVRGLRRDRIVGNEKQAGIEGQDVARWCRRWRRTGRRYRRGCWRDRKCPRATRASCDAKKKERAFS